MLLSPTPVTWNDLVFSAIPGAFQRNDAWMDQFYYGTYRGHNAGNDTMGSAPGQTHWNGISLSEARAACEANGEGYHTQSVFEWHDILARMVIEKNTFDLFPRDIRNIPESCQWRGIREMCYAISTGIEGEWVDGIKRGSSSRYAYWAQAGGSYYQSGLTMMSGSGVSDSLKKANTIYGDAGVNAGWLFLASSLDQYSFVPCYSGYNNTLSNTVGLANFRRSKVYTGAFSIEFQVQESLYFSSYSAARLAKW
jgi:hypothetical protein